MFNLEDFVEWHLTLQHEVMATAKLEKTVTSEECIAGRTLGFVPFLVQLKPKPVLIHTIEYRDQ